MEYLHKKFRNKVVSEIGKSKNDYYSQYFARHKSNMKMLWSGIRSIINVKSNVRISVSSFTIICLIEDASLIEDAPQLPQSFPCNKL